jgi:NAD(P) transhydrogenase subunit alpha
VAGLQATATARRLGGRVSATGRAAGGQGGDQVARRRLHRPRGREKPRRADLRRLRQGDERRLPPKQAEVQAEAIKKFDVVVCTALVQGR